MKSTHEPESATPPEARPDPSNLSAAGIEPMLSIDDLAAALACDRRTVERLKSAGKLPPPDLKVGRMPRWKPDTFRRWIDAQAGPGGGTMNPLLMRILCPPQLVPLSEAALLAGMPADVLMALALLLAEHPDLESMTIMPSLDGPLFDAGECRALRIIFDHEAEGRP